MHIVIMGCGRTGAALAGQFESRGHSVAVIDRVGDAFRRLPADFQGQRITGIGFDRETLVSAGVEDAYAFAAVSSGDNSNILAARVVRETYGVDNVVARIADPGRAEVYRRLGIPTVAPVPWTSSQILSRLLPGGADEGYTDETAGIAVRRLALHDAWIGTTVAALEKATQTRVAYLVRFGTAVLPEPTTTVQVDDELWFAIPDAARAHAERTVSRVPGGAK
ncbi:TrkA family potassium uptake protein [Demequina sp. NBRC 110057]|uniref:potassium channel family protein n=1 Tax=Demequina sp. NBRC 110057 TaxID=1570346 RepID=UPI001F452BC4|nr:TrkA family potassium uptake protein [Demequina sp. NBRC 110057]